jgi:hypothetical protein
LFKAGAATAAPVFCLGNLAEPYARITAALFPPDFVKVLGNTQSIACVFRFIRQKNFSLFSIRRLNLRFFFSFLYRPSALKNLEIHKVFLRIICLAERKNPPPIQSRRLKRRFRFCCFTDHFPPCFAKMLVNTQSIACAFRFACQKILSPIFARRLSLRFRFCCFTDYFPSCFAKMLVNT